MAEGGKLTAIHGLLTCASVTAQLPLERPDRAALEKLAASGSGTKKDDAKAMLAALDRGEALPAAHAAPVGAWQLGQEMTLLALPAMYAAWFRVRRPNAPAAGAGIGEAVPVPG